MSPEKIPAAPPEKIPEEPPAPTPAPGETEHAVPAAEAAPIDVELSEHEREQTLIEMKNSIVTEDQETTAHKAPTPATPIPAAGVPATKKEASAAGSGGGGRVWGNIMRGVKFLGKVFELGFAIVMAGGAAAFEQAAKFKLGKGKGGGGGGGGGGHSGGGSSHKKPAAHAAPKGGGHSEKPKAHGGGGGGGGHH